MQPSQTMMIGQLSQRTGVSIKVLRDYTDRGFLYTLGRSAGHYRLFGEEALWCVQTVQELRALGLTLHEIQSLAARYHEHPAEPIGPFLQRILRDVAARIAAQIASLQAQQQRIQEFQAAFAEASSDPPSAALAQMLNAECNTPFGGFARGSGHS
jgi:MerR family copper efflux transcriptional regulator